MFLYDLYYVIYIILYFPFSKENDFIISLRYFTVLITCITGVLPFQDETTGITAA